jgi:hypothetical protein
MTHEQFNDLIDAYGASPDRWPTAVRSAAMAYADASEEARNAMASTLQLDALLDGVVDRPQDSTATLENILAIPQQHRQVRWLRWARSLNWFSDADLDFSFVLPRLAGMAGAALIGFYIGTTDIVPLPAGDSNATIYTLTDLVFDTLPEESTL